MIEARFERKVVNKKPKATIPELTSNANFSPIQKKRAAYLKEFAAFKV